MSRHEQFEELSALAALGQISADELAELNAHIGECDHCRAARAEFTEVLHRGLPLADPEAIPGPRLSMWTAGRAGYRERFLARARTQGFRFSEEVEQRASPLSQFYFSFLRPNFASGLAILVLVGTGIVVYHWWGSRIAPKLARNTELQLRVSDLLRTRDVLQGKLANAQLSKKFLEQELTKREDARTTALARANALEQQMQNAITEAKRQRADLERAGALTHDLEGRLQAEERRLAELGGEIQKLRAVRADDAATIAAQRSRTKELSERLSAQSEMIERERQLLVAGRDIRDLMGARNLHIVDVRDVDGRGKDRRAFGRVFYTEGKSLIFYAFDLSNPKQVKAKHSFQAWGEREGATGSAKSLGIFYVDDQAQKRWVLKVEDLEVLRQIDAVFVTVEPFGGAKKPSGQKLLYAYLNGQPNHP